MADAPNWRCFQCDEVFTEATAAAEHFTGDTSYPPACVRQLQDGERWAHAEIARLEAHARHMYVLKTALETRLAESVGTAAVAEVYASVAVRSPLVSPDMLSAAPARPTGDSDEGPGKPHETGELEEHKALSPLATSNGSSVAGLPSSQEGSDTQEQHSAGKEDL